MNPFTYTNQGALGFNQNLIFEFNQWCFQAWSLLQFKCSWFMLNLG